MKDLKQILIKGLESEDYEIYVGLFNEAINCYLDYENDSDLCWYLDDSGYNFENYWGKFKDYDDIRDYYLEELTYENSIYEKAICSALNDIKDELIDLNVKNKYIELENKLFEEHRRQFEELLKEQAKQREELREQQRKQIKELLNLNINN
jgi:hypothetical protein